MAIFKEVFFAEDLRVYKGDLIIDSYKIFIQNADVPRVETYIPINNITDVILKKGCINIKIKLNSLSSRKIALRCEKKKLKQIISFLSSNFGFKKKFLRNVWKNSPVLYAR